MKTVLTRTDPNDDLTKPLPNADELAKLFAGSRSVWGILLAMGLRNKQVYAGTADPAKVEKRRARNRVARRSRRINRLRSK